MELQTENQRFVEDERAFLLQINSGTAQPDGEFRHLSFAEIMYFSPTNSN